MVLVGPHSLPQLTKHCERLIPASTTTPRNAPTAHAKSALLRRILVARNDDNELTACCLANYKKVGVLNMILRIGSLKLEASCW